MRTDLTADLSGARVRGVVTVGALIEISEHRDDFAAVMRRCAQGNVTDIRAVLVACLRAAGDLRPAEIPGEVDRLIEQGGLDPCQDFAIRLLTDAFNKAETSLGNSRAAAGETTTAAAD